MELDDFKGLNRGHARLEGSTPKDAVSFIDDIWYSETNRRGRWMDLIGDYAGNELFVIDGDSLLQLVLDDPLLALGRDDDLSFQILHAKHTLEKILSEFLHRSAVFEIVFWDSNRHMTQSTGGSEFVVASRTLARHMLLKHLERLSVPVHQFKNIQDTEWMQYVLSRKPMFVMMNDGGTLEDDVPESHIICVLLQRLAMFDLISQGLPLALLRGVEFHDSKILTFIFEQSNPQVERKLKARFLAIVKSAVESLRKQELAVRGALTPASVADFLHDEAANDAVEKNAIERFIKIAKLSVNCGHGLPSLLLHAFITHCVLLPQLPVESRARSAGTTHPQLFTLLHDTFLPTVYLVLVDARCGTDIDVDGRVFLEFLHFMRLNPDADPEDAVGHKVYAEVDALWHVQKQPPVDYTQFSTSFPLTAAEQSYRTAQPLSSASFSVMPFTNQVFDQVFASMPLLVHEDEGTSPVNEEFHIPFLDDRHWHNHRRAILPAHLGGDSENAAMDERQKARQLRSNQRFMAKMQWQAESLTGASGKALQRITIISDRQDRPKSNTKMLDSTGNKNKLKKVHISKADMIRQQNAEQKKAAQDSSNGDWWAAHLKQLASENTPKSISQVERLLNNNRTDDGWLAVDVRLYRINLEFMLWIDNPVSDGTDPVEQAKLRDRFSVSIVRMIKDLYERGGLYQKAFATLGMALQVLGFQDYAPSLQASSPNPSEEERDLTFKFVKLLRSKKKTLVYTFMPITEHPIEWQMRLFGEYLDRSMDGQRDPRVSFIPDAWQRKVLDCLDRNHSLLVVAPTSAGKTFISYYAMEQVLRESDEGVLVYIAPTKALVSQIAAEVYARFNKMFKSSGKTCWGIHTRDYRVNDPQNCQILVTVPEMLAIMLLSPPLARVWTPRVKRIILDEIHQIGQQEGGAVWEQIILLAPCPIIGLSATIGEPEKFNSWLASVQQAHGYEHQFIHHPHRYSHLRKFHYILHRKAPQAFQGLDTYTNTDRLRFLHPVSMLAFGARVLPPDFSLEAADCLSLFNAFRDVNAESKFDFDVANLCPSSFFGTDTFLQQKDIITYEQELKDVLARIISSSHPQNNESVLSLVLRKLEDPLVAAWKEQNANPASNTILSGLIHLVSDLYVSGDLPALAFMFDRSGCEIAAKFLLANLKKAEKQWRETSPVWKRTIQRWEEWKSRAAVRQRETERLLKVSKKEAADSKQSSEATWEETFDPRDPSRQFSFLGAKASKEYLEAAISDLRWTSTPSWVLDALRRGIGIHHSGMNKHYRTTVESLYRMGYLQVVFATGTLALGINAPTKTSVFCGDSPFLTALMYRQCAGRAGRRGFDLLGKVVFYGLPMDRVQRLVLSKLPSLGGSFPLTSTMVLRLFNLLQGSSYAPKAVDAIASILHLPQVSFVSETGKQEIMHHIRFSIDFLRRSALLDQNGNPVNFFGLATHLYYTEPSNFVIVALLRERVIHKICSQPSTEKAKRDLLLLLCHLFGRRYVPKVYTSEKNIKALLDKSPSKVILPPIHDAARVVLQQHDRETLRVFAGYAIAYVTECQTDLGPDQSLPLSRQSYAGNTIASPFSDHLRTTAIRTVARSTFVANSGHDDNFNNVEELITTVRSSVHLKEHCIPSLQRFVNSEGSTFPLNAYIYDFYMHGQVEALIRANGIRRGDIWYLLQDFMLTLKTIRSSIEQLVSNPSTTGSVVDGEASADPAEVDDYDSADEHNLARPSGISDEDWRVFEIVNMLTNEYDEKFRSIWA